MEIEFVGEFAASESQTSAGSLVIVSATIKDRIDLLQVQSLEIKGRVQTFLRQQIEQMKRQSPLEAHAMRANLSSEWGALMTKHLLLVQRRIDRNTGDVVADTAWRYETLTSWGEAAAAREISLELSIPINTIYYRLKLARDKGILFAPGPGARLGR